MLSIKAKYQTPYVEHTTTTFKKCPSIEGLSVYVDLLLAGEIEEIVIEADYIPIDVQTFLIVNSKQLYLRV